MAPAKGPDRWANDASIMLRVVLGENRFPVDVEQLALDWSPIIDPRASVTKVAERPLEGFEGALIDARGRGKGWGIAVNANIRSSGRRRFTVAHEFGHWLMHRDVSPQGGFQCRQEDMAAWDHDHFPQEVEANRFAAGLLMPLDDFRAQLPPRRAAGMEELGAVAERYGVSLTACALRWLEYTERRAVLVASRDGFVLWAKSSRSALRSGAYIRTRARPPVELPEASPLASGDPFLTAAEQVDHPAGTWFAETVTEEVIASGRYDLGLSLLTLAGDGRRTWIAEETEPDLVV